MHYQVYAPQGLAKPLLYVQWWIVGQSAFWKGDYAGAGISLQEAKRLLPRQVPIDRRQTMDAFTAALNWQLGYIFGPAQGNWQAARDYFVDSLRLSPQDPLAAVGLAATLIQLGDIDGASEILQQSLRASPDAWQLHYALAVVTLQQGDVAAAFAAYDRAIALLANSTSADAQEGLAQIYFDRGYYRLNHGDPAGALQDLQQAASLGLDTSYVQSSLAWAAYRSGDYETALRAAAAARRMAPGQPDLAFNEALILLAAGQIDAAHTAYNEAIQLTLTFDVQLTRSTYFGIATRDLDELLSQRPDLEADIRAIQESIDVANG